MRPIRDRDPSKIHLLTIRTEGARLFMVPSAKLNDLLGGITARYQEILGILIYAYAFLGNHYHLLVQAPLENLDEFAENVNREIARRVNLSLKRRGHFWQRRYSDQVVVSEVDVLEALIYITTNPTKHGLVSHPKLWPGLICYSQLLKENNLSFSFTHYSKRVLDEATGEVKTLKTNHTLKLSPLPQLAHLSPAERNELLSKRIEVRVRELQEGKTFPSPEKIRNKKPGGTPRNISVSRRPSCYSKCPEAKRIFHAELRLRMIHYKEASASYRLGGTGPPFPPNCFKPPLNRKPRIAPFKEFLSAA